MSTFDLYNGDCLEILPTLPAQSVEAIITDLPYGTTACAWDSVIPFAPMWEQVKRVLKPRGAFVTTASQPFTSALIMSNVEWFKYCLVWDKPRMTGFLDANNKPLKSHEDIAVFCIGQTTYNPQMRKGKYHRRGSKLIHASQSQSDVYGSFEDRVETFSDLWYPKSIVTFSHDPETTVTIKDRPNKQELHPNRKPVALYEYLIRTYTNPGDVVLDFVMGSGTTIVSAIKTGRNAIGIERDAYYFAIAERRIRDAAAQPVLFTLDTPQPKPDQSAMW